MIEALRRTWRRIVAWLDWRKTDNGPEPWKSWED